MDNKSPLDHLSSPCYAATGMGKLAAGLDSPHLVLLAGWNDHLEVPKLESLTQSKNFS